MRNIDPAVVFPAQAGNSGNLLKTDGASPFWSVSGLGPVTVRTTGASYTASSSDIVIVNLTTSAIFTVNLPASPIAGNQVLVKDGKGIASSYSLTISGNGKTIDGASTVLIDRDYGAAWLVYNGTQWNVLSLIEFAVAG